MTYKTYIADPSRACAIIAHRGIWQDAPENSLLAVERAILAGHDVVEIDVRQSLDGEFFLLHDDTLERMTGLDEAPEVLNAERLSSLALRNRDGGQANPLTEQRLARLKDVFSLTRDRILIHLDVKQKVLIPDVLALARAMGVEDQVDVWAPLAGPADFDWITQEVMPTQAAFIAKTRLNAANGAEQLDLVLRLAPSICEIYYDNLDEVAALAPRFAEAGIALWVNTLDDVSSAGFTDTAALRDPEAVWGRLLDAGISAIQTDEAAALKRFLASRSR